VSRLIEDFERVCAFREVAGALPTAEGVWDFRELLESVEDEELRAWAVRQTLPLIDPGYVPISEEEARRVRARAERERVSA
jgi:hypothetical protein